MRHLFWLFLLLLLIIPLRAQDDDTFRQTQFDTIVQVGADSTTAMYSFNYIQPPEMTEFRWLFPIPADATRVELGAALTAPLLQSRTAPVIEPPQESCEMTPILVIGSGREPIVDYFPPDDAQLTRFDSVDAALDWLGDDAVQDVDSLRGYDAFAGVTIIPQTATEVGDTDDGFIMRVNVSPLVIVEYPGTDVFLPLDTHAPTLATRLDNYARSDIMPVTAYVFADMPYAPTDYTSLSVDLTQLRAPWNNIAGIMRNFDGTGIFFNALDPDYYALVQDALAAVDGRGFITEYRQAPSLDFAPNVRDRLPNATAQLAALHDEETVLTRLRTFIDATGDLPEPAFAPAPMLDLTRIDLTQVADPAQFYGCTTRTLYNPDLESRLPEGRTYIDALDVHVAHPVGWSLYTLDSQTYAFAPEAVTLDTLRALERGEDAPPMLVLRRFEQEFMQDMDGHNPYVPDHTWEPFTFTSSADAQPTAARNAVTLYYPSPGALGELLPAEGMHVAVVATHTDFAEDEALYVDLLDYVTTRQFWLSPELRHTLFMYDRPDLVMIGYPDGWIETLDADRHRMIVPENRVDDFADAPYVREIVPPERETALAWIRDRYGLDDAADLRSLTRFNANGRTGYVQSKDGFYRALIEVSAPDALYDDYAPLLTEIAETMRIHFQEAG